MLVRLNENDLKMAGIPFTAGTLYVWHAAGKHAELFVKIGKRLFISKENWDKMEKRLALESEKKAKQIEKISKTFKTNTRKIRGV